MRFMKRQAYTIASEMLYFALLGVNKTRLTYSCSLSHKRGEKYITTLLKNGLLEKKEDIFHTTKKGIQFLEIYQKLERLWNTTYTRAP